MKLPVINQSSGVEDVALCKECGGKCCEAAPGGAYPEDFGPRETMARVMADYFKTGFWGVDSWDGDPRPYPQPGGALDRVLYVRPHTVEGKGRKHITDWSWGGACCLWNPDTGCSLEFANRPHQCRVVIPGSLKQDGMRHCSYPQGDGADDRPKRVLASAWIDYQDEIELAMKLAKNRRIKP
jgi:hypothetical protein